MEKLINFLLCTWGEYRPSVRLFSTRSYAIPIPKRPFFFKLGHIEVYAEAWQHLKEEPLVQYQKGSSPFATAYEWWMPGMHLIVSVCRYEAPSV